MEEYHRFDPEHQGLGSVERHVAMTIMMIIMMKMLMMKMVI